MRDATNNQSTGIPIYPMPFVRTDLAVLCVRDGVLQVLLGKRQKGTEGGKFGLPGGVLRIDIDANLESAAQRVAIERLGRALPNLEQVCAVGGPKRDPERSDWALTMVYRSLVQPDLQTAPGKRLDVLDWHVAEDAIISKQLAFDHAELIGQAVRATQAQVADLRIPQGWVPEPFTLPELQAFCEAVLGQRLDKVTFRRRVMANAVVEPIEGEMRIGGAHRPAQVYRLR